MTDRRYRRNLLTLHRLLTEHREWRLSPAQWARAGRAIENLGRYLAAQDAEGVNAVLRQLEDVEPGSRAVTRIDDPGWIPVPEPISIRIVELVPIIVEQLDSLGVNGYGLSDTAAPPSPTTAPTAGKKPPTGGPLSLGTHPPRGGNLRPDGTDQGPGRAR